MLIPRHADTEPHCYPEICFSWDLHDVILCLYASMRPLITWYDIYRDTLIRHAAPCLSQRINRKVCFTVAPTTEPRHQWSFWALVHFVHECTYTLTSTVLRILRCCSGVCWLRLCIVGEHELRTPVSNDSDGSFPAFVLQYTTTCTCWLAGSHWSW